MERGMEGEKGRISERGQSRRERKRRAERWKERMNINEYRTSTIPAG